MGDIRVLIPPDIQTFVHCSNFVGDIDALGQRTDGFGNNLDAQTAGYNDAEKKLYIAANSFIGDIRIMIV